MIIGLTGKSCSGKNYVGNILESMGLLVWDMDKMCHEGLYENVDALIKAFGDSIISYEDSKMVILRSKISKIVFNNPAKRQELEDILYPSLKKKVLSWKKDNGQKVLVINGALLYRSGFDCLCDAIIYVDASYNERLKRAIERDKIDEKTFLLREEAQKDVDYNVVIYRAPLYVIDNNDSNLENVNRQTFSICDKLAIIRY